MADYTFKGLTGVYGTVTHNPGDDLGDLIVSIATAEGLPIDYYAISNEDDPSKNDTTYDDSSTSIVDAGFVPSSRIICTPRQDGTKERRQIQKLEIAQVKRQGTFRDTGTYTNPSDAPYYRTLNTYDKDLLPNPYNGNSADPDDGDAGPLDDGRPWT